MAKHRISAKGKFTKYEFSTTSKEIHDLEPLDKIKSIAIPITFDKNTNTMPNHVWGTSSAYDDTIFIFRPSDILKCGFGDDVEWVSQKDATTLYFRFIVNVQALRKGEVHIDIVSMVSSDNSSIPVIPWTIGTTGNRKALEKPDSGFGNGPNAWDCILQERYTDQRDSWYPVDVSKKEVWVATERKETDNV